MMKKVLSTGGVFTDNAETYVVNGHRFNCDNLLDIATSKAFKPTFVPDALEICKKITTTVKDQNGQLCNLCYGCAYQPIGDNASPVVPVNITTTEFVDDEYNKKHALQVKLSQTDMNLLKSCADNYDANFLNIATKLADLEHTPLRAFVFYILSHYQLKVTDRFRQAPQSFVAKSDEADSDKAIKNYSNLLISSVNNSANVVINSFLIFVKNKNELDNMSLIDAYDHGNLEYAVQDKISQVVADYLSTEKIENLATLPAMDDLLDLSDQAKEELNLILVNADLNTLDFNNLLKGNPTLFTQIKADLNSFDAGDECWKTLERLESRYGSKPKFISLFEDEYLVDINWGTDADRAVYNLEVLNDHFVKTCEMGNITDEEQQFQLLKSLVKLIEKMME